MCDASQKVPTAMILIDGHPKQPRFTKDPGFDTTMPCSTDGVLFFLYWSPRVEWVNHLWPFASLSASLPGASCGRPTSSLWSDLCGAGHDSGAPGRKNPWRAVGRAVWDPFGWTCPFLVLKRCKVSVNEGLCRAFVGLASSFFARPEPQTRPDPSFLRPLKMGSTWQEA